MHRRGVIAVQDDEVRAFDGGDIHLRPLDRADVQAGADPAGEEHIVDLVLLNALAEAFGVPDQLGIPLLPGEKIVVETKIEGKALAHFLASTGFVNCSHSSLCHRNKSEVLW